MNFVQRLKEWTVAGIKDLYDADVDVTAVIVNDTPDDFNGDFTIVTFPFAKAARQAPPQVAEKLGQHLLDNHPLIKAFNIVKGFLNLIVSDEIWVDTLAEVLQDPTYGHAKKNSGDIVMIEFASPNTNKPLHLGHVRNILLGWSISKILDAAGHQVIKTQVINDRGIAISKSMVAWMKYANGETPHRVNIKGDHFVGDYYVKFAQALNKEYSAWTETDEAKKVFLDKKKDNQTSEDFFKQFKDAYFNQFSDLGREAREVLRQWEKGDPETLRLWRSMNRWVLDGFEETYQTLGVSFEKSYLESDIYLLGKEIINDGIGDGVFFRKEDGSVAVDLTDKKLDEKVVLRNDGTSLYVTQDIGLAQQRYDEFGMDSVVYVVGNEQIYHFKALFAILDKLGVPYAEKLYHLAYGMVDLTTGKMKSREGTVVDADDLIESMVLAAEAESKSRKGTSDTEEDEEDTKKIATLIAHAALKYFILKVNPKRRMVFDPEESIDFQGQTGPYIQYAYVRCHGLRKKQSSAPTADSEYTDLNAEERDILKLLADYPNLIRQAGKEYDPSIIAGFAYQLAKAYSKFWHEHSVLNAKQPGAIAFRFKLSEAVAKVLGDSMDLLGIQMPDKM